MDEIKLGFLQKVEKEGKMPKNQVWFYFSLKFQTLFPNANGHKN